MGSLDDESFPEPLLSMTSDDDEHKDVGHSDSYTLNSDSKGEDGSNQWTTNAGSSCSTSSTKSSMKKLFHKQFSMASTPAPRNKPQLMAKKSHSYQDLHLPSIRRRYSNVQSKVKLYIDSIQPARENGGGGSHTKRTPLLRHKSMPETYQNMMQDDMTSIELVDECPKDRFGALVESKLELERENILLCKKVDDMRLTIAQLKVKTSPEPGLAGNWSTVCLATCSVATQTDPAIEETNALALAYELSATKSVKSLVFNDSTADNNLLVQDNSPQEVTRPRRRKKSSFLRRKFRKMFSCIEVGVH